MKKWIITTARTAGARRCSMTLSELKKVIDESCDGLKELGKDPDEISVVIPYVPDVPTMGASPAVSIKGAGLGFDWDAGRFFLEPEEKLALFSHS